MSQRKFEEFVKVLAEESYHGNEEVDLFESKLESLGYERPYFGIARSQYDSIDFYTNYHILGRQGCIRYYAEYYDGFQAPFEVFTWNEDFNLLENLLKENFSALYELYEKRLREVEKLYGFQFE